MQVLGGILLFLLIVSAGVYVGGRVTAGARQRMPHHARPLARSPVRGAGKSAGGSVRGIKAKPWAEVRSQNWLDKERLKRERQAARPSRAETAGRAVRATGHGLTVTAKGAGRAIGKGISAIPRPRTAILLPGVTDQPERQGLRSVPAWPAPPGQPSSVPESAPAPDSAPQLTERPSAMAPISRTSVPPDFAALTARIAQFEPESDGDLIAFLRGVATGTAAIGDALEQHADHLSSGVGLDPAATAAVTEAAQAFTEAAQAVSRADARFQALYSGVRETVASGTVLPFRGRFITGESA